LVEQGTFNPKVAGSIPARPIPEPANRVSPLAGKTTRVDTHPLSMPSVRIQGQHAAPLL
jgi:hypothetical protein